MTWTQSGNIKGASGTPGASGAQGASGVPGASGPTGATGASGGTGGTGGPGTTNWADIVDKPGAILNYKGTWNASTNTSPTLSDGTGSGGDVYRVSVGASRNLGSGTIVWDVGDYAIWSPVTSSWEKADTTDAVSSVAGRTGAVTLTSADLGASGTASSSTFLRGDNAWATPTGITRSISTVTANTTVGSAANTDYVVFANIAATTSTPDNFSSVVAQLHMDGTNNSTTIVDSSNLAANWTCTGNAKLATGTKKFGTASLSMSGTSGDRITASAAASNFGFGTSAWTIEFFLYLNSVSGNQNVYVGGGAGSTDPLLYMAGASMTYYSGGGTVVISSASLSTATWYHIAACRSGSTTKLFINGTAVNAGVTDNINYASNTPTIGFSGSSFNGFVDEVRIYKGFAAYTSNFTAPTAAFAETTLIPGTVTLPTAASNSNKITVRNTHSTDALNLATTSSQTINGAAPGTLATGAVTSVISNGSNWFTV